MTMTISQPTSRTLGTLYSGDFGERYRLTRAACEMLEKAGLLSERWELIEGEVVVKVGQKNLHAKAVALLFAYLLRAVGVERARTQATMEVPGIEGETNVPEPDGMILKASNDEDRYLTTNDVETVIEVCHSSETRDYTAKMRLYARCGIPEYWLLDLNKRTLTLCREPDTMTGEWAIKTENDENAFIAPLAAPSVTTRVGDLLPT